MSAQSGWENAEGSANAIPADFIDLDAYPLDGRDPRCYAAAVGSAKDQVELSTRGFNHHRPYEMFLTCPRCRHQ